MARRRFTKRMETMMETLEFTGDQERAIGGNWRTGTIAGHAFQALVFPEHADNPAHELGRTRMSKFWLRREADETVVVDFDRGWIVKPTSILAREIMDLLGDCLAEATFNG